MSRCAWPCGHCGTQSLGPVVGARRCRRCRQWTPADRPPEVKVAPAVQWRGVAEKFAATLAAEQERLVLDARRARERGQVEWARSIAAFEDRVAGMRHDTEALLIATAADTIAMQAQLKQHIAGHEDVNETTEGGG